MTGLDLLGVEPIEGYVGASTANVTSTVSKINAAAKHASSTAAKLQKSNPKLAALLSKLSSTATAKSQKLQKAASQPAVPAKKPPVKPLVKPLAKQVSSTPRATASLSAMRSSIQAVSSSPASPSSASSSSSPSSSALPPSRRSAAVSAVKSMSKHVIGALNAAEITAMTTNVAALIDTYNDFANAVDDASVAADAVALIQPMLPQLQTLSPTLYNSGNNLVMQAQAVINAVQAPADPAQVSMGYSSWIGDISQSGAALMAQAEQWATQARAILSAPGQAGAQWLPYTHYSAGSTVTNGPNKYTANNTAMSGGSPGPQGISGTVTDGSMQWTYAGAAPASAVAAGAQWMPLTAYPAGAAVTNGANRYTAQTAGTSGPMPGPQATSGVVQDGTVQWAYAGAGTPPAMWSPNTPYQTGVSVTNGTNQYVSRSAGTSGAAPGPQGTYGAIMDGTVQWMYTGAATGTGPVVQGAQWMPNTAYGAGSTVTNAGNTYSVSTPGTSGSYPGPQSMQNVPIPDGTVQWMYTGGQSQQPQGGGFGGGGGGGDGGGGGGGDGGGGDSGGDQSDGGDGGGDSGYPSDDGGGGDPGSPDDDSSDDGSSDDGSDDPGDGTDPGSAPDPFANTTDSVGHGGGGHGGGGHGGRGGRGSRGGPWGLWGGGWWDEGDGFDSYALEPGDEEVDAIAKAVVKHMRAGKTQVGMYDFNVEQRKMNGLKKFPATIAQSMLAAGQTAISGAIQGAMRANLPGTTSRAAVQARLQQEAITVAALASTPYAMYPSPDTLTAAVSAAFLEANAVQEGAAYLQQAWDRMLKEIQTKLEALPKEVVDKINQVVPSSVKWILGGLGAVAAAVGGFAAYKKLT